MVEAVAGDTQIPEKRSKLPLLVGLGLAVVLGAAGFYVTWAGMILAPDHPAPEAAAMPTVAFVPVPPLIVTLPAGANAQHLRFTAELEVMAPHVDPVAALMPRILDVLNAYLRAVDAKDIEDPAALTRLRANMLRRVQLVVGDGRVRDLLVTEFVLN